jgi:hypothetical protein
MRIPEAEVNKFQYRIPVISTAATIDRQPILIEKY